MSPNIIFRMWASDQTCSSSTNYNLTSTLPSDTPSLAPPPGLLTTNVATIKAQNSYVSSLVLTQNFLYTGSSDNEIRLWKLGSLNSPPDYENVSTVVAGKGAVKHLMVSSNNNRLITAHQDHKIRVWKIDERMKITHVATLPTLGDRAIKLLAPKNHIHTRRHKMHTWVHHVDTVSALALSTEESLLYSVSWDRTLKIWRTDNFKCLESVANAHEDAINAIAVSKNGHVFTASSDKKIKVWRRGPAERTHSLVDTLEKHGSGVNALALLDGMVLYSGGSDGSILMWTDTGSGRMEAVAEMRGHVNSVLCLDIVSELVFSGSADYTVRIWRGFGRSCYACLGVLEGHKGPVKCITAASDHYSSSDGVRSYILYSASLDCDIKLWKILLPKS